MRSCIYCGRTLEKDEKCNCPQSVKAREAKSRASSESASSSDSSWQNHDNVYTTGYTKKERKKRFRGFRKKSASYKNINKQINVNGLSNVIKRFVKDPVNTVASPGTINSLQLILLILLVGIVTAGVWFFASGFLYSVASQSLGVPFTRHYDIVKLLLTLVFGGIGAAVLMLAMFGILWCIGKFVLKQSTRFFDFCTRLVLAALPVAIWGAFGILFGFFASFSLLIFSCVGIIMWLILSFEALKCEWSFLNSSRVLYLMSAGIFLILVVLLNIVIL